MDSTLVSTLCLTLSKLAFDLTNSGDEKTPKMLEILFTGELVFVVLSIAHMKFVTRDYLFNFANRELALSLAHRIALYTLFNTVCLSNLSLYTFAAIQIACVALTKLE